MTTVETGQHTVVIPLCVYVYTCGACVKMVVIFF